MILLQPGDLQITDGFPLVNHPIIGPDSTHVTALRQFLVDGFLLLVGDGLARAGGKYRVLPRLGVRSAALER